MTTTTDQSEAQEWLDVKLSPSDFRYLYEECPRCAHLKLADKVSTPSEPFPGIFSKIDRLARNAFRTPADLERIGLKGFTPIEFPASFVSVPVEFEDLKVRVSVTIKMDSLALGDDGLLHVWDFKTTDPTEKSLAGYEKQLSGYSWGVAHPDEKGRKGLLKALGLKDGDPLPGVGGMGIVAWNPVGCVWWDDSIKEMFANGWVNRLDPQKWQIDGQWSAHPLPFDHDAFAAFLRERAEFVRGPRPAPGAKCPRCNWLAKLRGLDMKDSMEKEVELVATLPLKAVAVPAGRPPVVRKFNRETGRGG